MSSQRGGKREKGISFSTKHTQHGANELIRITERDGKIKNSASARGGNHLCTFAMLQLFFDRSEDLDTEGWNFQQD
jgi:hypothetical protein